VTDPPCRLAIRPDALLCAVALEPQGISRNRFFWAYSEPKARRAHARALSLRRLVQQIAPLLSERSAHVTVAETDRGFRMTYRDERLALRRTVHLTPLEASLVRLMLPNFPLLPEVLRQRDEDRTRVLTALRGLLGSPELLSIHQRLDALVCSRILVS
jgi:hypothetical protein